METIVERVMGILPNQKPVIIGVSGTNGSGFETQARALQGELVKQGILVHLEELMEEPVDIDPENPAKSWYEQSMPDHKANMAIENAKLHRELDIVIVSGAFLLKNTLDHLYDTSIWIDCTKQTAREREYADGQVNIEWKFGAQRIHEIIDEPKQKANLIIQNDPRLEQGPRVIQEGFHGGKWLNEPSSWMERSGSLTVETDRLTDFWQRTHYGFSNDNGHFYYFQTDLDFMMTVTVKGEPIHQFDQAGLMIRVDEDNWLKTSLEHEVNQHPKLGAVATNFGYSDWSTQETDEAIQELTYRVTRTGNDYKIDVLLKGNWQQLRVTRLHHDEKKVMCGIYCCSPIEKGFHAEFSSFRLVELF
ncbi:DUF1349 domain-containing protein [Metabacillus sp. KIGAM252]|uniref:DUF1349 domain-containing protein n=1 Tax=Metabacillus flavus TaxID=2823519 RepID=A0ABS5LD84_9BACI|nr:DUF1349 domain-containing protein [Metabacillus flavus]MBS2968700.1 DUF1349 domain-containing protein [Metabacillus flavus]